MKRIVLVGTVLLLLPLVVGCGTLEIPLAVYSDEHGYFGGTLFAAYGQGYGNLEANDQQSGISCQGSYIYSPPQSCLGEAKAKLFCNDGRRITGTAIATGCTSGRGYATDDRGGRYIIVYGSEASEILASRPSQPAFDSTSSKPPNEEEPKEATKKIPAKTTDRPAGSGTGFFISRMGHVVTNAHVVEGCKRVTVGDNANKQTPAEVISTDKRNDLALLKLSSLNMASAETKSLIRKLEVKLVPLAADGLLRSQDVELGEKVMVAGYPYGDVFSNTIKVTSGIVSAVRGMGDDTGQFQMDAAVQSGNSGGPVYDENGNIVGVVVAQLNKLKVAKAIGSLPENVNFGIKASTVRQFLTSSGLPSKWSERSKYMSTKQLAKIAEKQTLMVMCHQ